MNQKKGFTLIELLMVIAIIGVVAALVIPSCARHRNQPPGSAVQVESPSSTPMKMIFTERSSGVQVMTFCDGTTKVYVAVEPSWDSGPAIALYPGAVDCR